MSDAWFGGCESWRLYFFWFKTLKPQICCFSMVSNQQFALAVEPPSRILCRTPRAVGDSTDPVDVSWSSGCGGFRVKQKWMKCNYPSMILGDFISLKPWNKDPGTLNNQVHFWSWKVFPAVWAERERTSGEFDSRTVMKVGSWRLVKVGESKWEPTKTFEMIPN